MWHILFSIYIYLWMQFDNTVTNLTSRTGMFVEMLTVASLFKYSPHFVGHEVLLLCSQGHSWVPILGSLHFCLSIILAVMWFSNLNGDFLDISAPMRQSAELEATFMNYAMKAVWREHYTVHNCLLDFPSCALYKGTR